jgi:hypothetical protein
MRVPIPLIENNELKPFSSHSFIPFSFAFEKYKRQYRLYLYLAVKVKAKTSQLLPVDTSKDMLSDYEAG